MKRMIFLIVCVSCFSSPLQAQDDFYKGKQMKIVVGASAGAASDLYARVVAHHLPKQIPGKPDIIVQNMKRTTSCSSCVRISPIKRCSICAKPVNHRAAVPRELAARASIFLNC